MSYRDYIESQFQHAWRTRRAPVAPSVAAFERMTIVALDETVRIARRRCPAYLRGMPKQVRGWAEFREIPILTRRVIQDDTETLMPRQPRAFSYAETSGTTTGASVRIPFTSNERLLRLKLSFTMRPVTPPGYTLQLVAQGRVIPPQVNGDRTLIVPCALGGIRYASADSWDNIISILFTRRDPVSGSGSICALDSAFPYLIIMLTGLMKERGVPPGRTAVRQLSLYGTYVASATRTVLEQTWRARTEMFFSCTELPCNAVECSNVRGRYHYVLGVVPEVLSRSSDEPVEVGGEGRLVLTGLYPLFQSIVPIRYDVGDWVRWLGPQECSCGRTGYTFEPLDRTKHVVFVRGKDVEIGLSARPTLEALAELPGVRQIPRPQYRYEVVPGRGGRQRVRLHVECNALADRAWQAALRATIRRRVHTSLPALAASQIALDVVLHARGTLTESDRRK
jgi:phenylacetate-coenzyme A ligase PaaK-like adenylate-forming protein